MSQGFRIGLVGWSWLVVPCEITVRILARAAVIWRLDSGWRICFQNFTSQHIDIGCWQETYLSFLHVDLFVQLLECPHDMTPDFPHCEWSRRVRWSGLFFGKFRCNSHTIKFTLLKVYSSVVFLGILTKLWDISYDWNVSLYNAPFLSCCFQYFQFLVPSSLIMKSLGRGFFTFILLVVCCDSWTFP